MIDCVFLEVIVGLVHRLLVFFVCVTIRVSGPERDGLQQCDQDTQGVVHAGGYRVLYTNGSRVNTRRGRPAHHIELQTTQQHAPTHTLRLCWTGPTDHAHTHTPKFWWTGPVCSRCNNACSCGSEDCGVVGSLGTRMRSSLLYHFTHSSVCSFSNLSISLGRIN